MEKKEMKQPQIVGVEAAACIANVAAAVAVFGESGTAIAATGALCNLPAVVPIIGAGSIIA